MPRQAETNLHHTIRSMLRGGDRRSIGRSSEVAGLVLRRPQYFRKLMECLWDDDPIVRMRAADAAEKASRPRPGLLKPFKAKLLGLLADARQQELRWHLAQMVPRLPLTGEERQRAASHLRGYLSDRSSIVKTLAMQGLADLAQHDARMRPEVADLIEELTRTGTAAMRARGRKLLGPLGK